MSEQKTGYPLDYSKGSANAGRVAERAVEYGKKALHAVENFKPYVERSMKDQPMATLGIAAVIGFVLGALWKK